MTRVQHKKSGRIETTIPTKYASNLAEPDGHHLSWHVESRDRLRATPEGPDPPGETKTTVIQYNAAAQQYTVAIPTALVHAMHMTRSELNWDYVSGSFIIDIDSRGGNDD